MYIDITKMRQRLGRAAAWLPGCATFARRFPETAAASNYYHGRETGHSV